MKICVTDFFAKAQEFYYAAGGEAGGERDPPRHLYVFGGDKHPTLTMMALAARACDAISLTRC